MWKGNWITLAEAARRRLVYRKKEKKKTTTTKQQCIILFLTCVESFVRRWFFTATITTCSCSARKTVESDYWSKTYAKNIHPQNHYLLFVHLVTNGYFVFKYKMFCINPRATHRIYYRDSASTKILVLTLNLYYSSMDFVFLFYSYYVYIPVSPSIYLNKYLTPTNISHVK